AYKASVDMIESIRGRLDQRERLDFLGENFDPYRGVVDCLWRLSELVPGPDWSSQAFRYAEMGKARSLRDHLVGAHAKAVAGIPPALLSEGRRIDLALGEARTDLAKADK